MASNTSSSSSASGSTYQNSSSCEEIRQDGKTMLRLSDRKHIFIVPDIFRGQLYVNIREYRIDNTVETETDEDRYLPTKKGVCFNEEEFHAFVERLDRVQGIVKRLKRKLKKEKRSPDGHRQSGE